MTDWSFVPGVTPAFVTDALAVVASGNGAEEAVARLNPQHRTLEEAVEALTVGGIVHAPDFAVCALDGDHLTAVVRGNVLLRVEGDWAASSTLTGAHARTWREVAFEGVSRVAVIPPGAGIDAHATTRDIGATRAEPGTHTVAALKYEHRPNTTILDTPGGRNTSTCAPIPVRTDAFPEHLFDTTILSGEQHTKLVAVTCRNEHANPPERSDCGVCGVPLENQELVRVARPGLGVMSVSGAPDVPIEGVILIGRHPRGSVTDSEGTPTLVTVSDPTGDVSRTHARVFVEGWNVLLEDLGSANGTTLVSGSRSIQLRPGDPVTVKDGDVAVLAETARIKFRGIA